MSIDISWPTLTSGPSGSVLAEQIRDFIDAKFQQVALPRFIQSVRVHAFDLGQVAPEVELRDLGDPLADFYEGGEEEEEEEEEEEGEDMAASRGTVRADDGPAVDNPDGPPPLRPHNQGGSRPPPLRTTTTDAPPPFSPPLLGRSPTPSVPGGTSTLNHYFHSPLTAGLSGSHTPLAAVAGAQLPAAAAAAWLDYAASATEGAHPRAAAELRHDSSASVESLSPPSTAGSGSAKIHPEESAAAAAIPPPHTSPTLPSRRRRRRSSDFQVIARVRYSGDVALSLTAMILLDYPMPSFVSIPVKLNITGLSFDGVAVLAFIRRKNVHFCFLSPEDAGAMGVGGGGGEKLGGGSLLREIKVESEIGQREGGKQSLKNVGKVEKFVLEQVRRIFEEEFVYPSFWTFLV
ncbi:MAG: Mitochondrial distribution and morphology protein 12 [Trichoglossum hirsutum]|nr:MAG: Mitochondrial distribution and morphology protein 12 [Trichoglossum hirsutum]